MSSTNLDSFERRCGLANETLCFLKFVSNTCISSVAKSMEVSASARKTVRLVCSKSTVSGYCFPYSDLSATLLILLI